jgi:Domain of unknown function (DUF5666)
MAIHPSATYIDATTGGAEMNINRLAILSVTVAVVGLLASAGPVSAQTKEARGTVSAVTEKTITIKAGTQELTFDVDSQTRLEVRSAAKEVQAAQPGNPRPRVNQFFEVGMPVLVRYREEKGRNHALDIERVGSAGSGGGGVADPSKIADGKVTAVSASSMTVSSGGKDLTFAVTKDTDVLVKGATKATNAAGGSTTLSTFVHSGDTVSVSYKEAGGTMTASEIRVRISAK